MVRLLQKVFKPYLPTTVPEVQIAKRRVHRRSVAQPLRHSEAADPKDSELLGEHVHQKAAEEAERLTFAAVTFKVFRGLAGNVNGS